MPHSTDPSPEFTLKGLRIEALGPVPPGQSFLDFDEDGVTINCPVRISTKDGRRLYGDLSHSDFDATAAELSDGGAAVRIGHPIQP